LENLYYGLFGALRGKVENLGVENVNIKLNSRHVGSIAGAVWGNGEIDNCYVYGGTVSTETTNHTNDFAYYGGIAGYVVGSVRNSYSTADVAVYTEIPYWNREKGLVSAGGIAGYVAYEEEYSAPGSIRNSMALGSKIFNKNGPVSRIAYSSNGIFANNKAFAGMLNKDGKIEWANKGSDKMDGLDILNTELQIQSGYLALFAASPWTYQTEKLPGLNSEPVEMPEYLTKMPTTIAKITIAPKTLSIRRGTNSSNPATQAFIATVEGTGDYQSLPVVWSVSIATGSTNATINSSTGVLTVPSNETPSGGGANRPPLLVKASITHEGETIEDIATVTVTASDVAPTVTGDQTLTLRVGYAATSTNAYTVLGTGAVTVEIVSSNAGPNITWNDVTKKLDIAAGLTAGSYTVVLKASNSAITNPALTFALTVLPTPTVTNVVVNPSAVEVQKDFSQTFVAEVMGTDGPSQEVTWTVQAASGSKAAGTVISSDGELYIDRSETATQLIVTATSVENSSKSGTATVTVADEPIPPTIAGQTTLALAQGYSATSVGYILSGTKPITVTLTDFYPSAVGFGATWNSATNKLEIPAGLPIGTYRVTIRAAGIAGEPASLTLTLTVASHIASVTVEAGGTTVKKGKTQTFTASVTVVEGAAGTSSGVNWSITSTHHSYTTIDASGVLSVYASETATSITVRAVSKDDPTKSANTTISVINPELPQISTPVALPTGTVLAEYSQTLAATSVVEPITWELKYGSSLPSGLFLNPNGTIAGTPLEDGSFAFYILATNDDGSSERRFTLTINAELNISSVAITTNVASVKKGKTQTFAASVAGTGVYSQTVTWSIEGTVASGTSINATTGVLTVAANETAATITVKATSAQDNTKSATKPVSVVDLEPPQITTPAALAGIIGVAYNQTLAATGATPIAWSLESGSSLPAGLTLASTGVISGTPSKDSTFKFTIVATNDDGSANREFTLTIRSSVTSVAVAPATATVEKGKTQTFAATVAGRGNFSQTVTWSILEQVASGTSINATTGVLTVAANETLATITIVATSAQDNTKSGSAIVTVIDQPTPIIASKLGTSFKAWMQNGTLRIAGLNVGKAWSIYTASGVLVSSGIASSPDLNVNLNTPSGVYYIKSNGQTFKVVNR